MLMVYYCNAKWYGDSNNGCKCFKKKLQGSVGPGSSGPSFGSAPDSGDNVDSGDNEDSSDNERRKRSFKDTYSYL